MNGSEKQIAWATEIRAAAVAYLRSVQARMAAEHRPQVDRLVAALESVTDARWLIDQRGNLRGGMAMALLLHDRLLREKAPSGFYSEFDFQANEIGAEQFEAHCGR